MTKPLRLSEPLIAASGNWTLHRRLHYIITKMLHDRFEEWTSMRSYSRQRARETRNCNTSLQVSVMTKPPRRAEPLIYAAAAPSQGGNGRLDMIPMLVYNNFILKIYYLLMMIKPCFFLFRRYQTRKVLFITMRMIWISFKNELASCNKQAFWLHGYSRLFCCIFRYTRLKCYVSI